VTQIRQAHPWQHLSSGRSASANGHNLAFDASVDEVYLAVSTATSWPSTH
jgi:hypothetical protein